jgi:two-component system, LuxR family, response regulator FixJ
MKSDPIVHVVEDDEAHQSAICLILDSVRLGTRVYASAQQFLQDYEPARHEGPECLVTDVRLPGMSGLELQNTLLEQKILLPTVVISGHADVPIAVEAVKKGAIDFIEKPFRQQKLLDAIQVALAASEEAQKQKASYLKFQSRLASLTGRQREVMNFMIDGKPNKKIAEELGLSIKTVEQHRSLVMKNMEAASFAELVQIVLEFEDSQG